MTNAPATPDKVPASDAVLIYDGECPVCSAYVTYVRFRESVGRVQLVNARSAREWFDRVQAQGLDLDEGMVLVYGGRFYHGADCIHMLALLSTPSGVFNRLNAAIFRRPRLARWLYPVLRAGRNMLLRILGRSRINSKDAAAHQV
jgi:predicted DCC family thiol-disulfide oxidoreductase YuxK